MDAQRQNWDPAGYARNSSPQLAWARELISGILFKGTESVLDIGCGDGKVTALLAARVPRGRVIGIDASAGMVELARTSFPAAGGRNLAFRRMDATRLEFTETFDIAFSNAALHWIDDQPAVLGEVRRCMGTGGRLVFQMGGKGNAAGIISALDRVIHEPAWEDLFADFRVPYNFCGADEYRSWLLAHAFVPRRVELVPKDMRHGNPAELKGWIRSTWFPYTDRLPPGRRDEFLDRAVEAYIRDNPLDDEGHTHVKMVRLEVDAVAS